MARNGIRRAVVNSSLYRHAGAGFIADAIAAWSQVRIALQSYHWSFAGSAAVRTASESIMSAEFRPEYLSRLPLPLARLYSRAHNDKFARSRHDFRYFTFEATVRLAVAPLVCAYADEHDVRASPTGIQTSRPGDCEPAPARAGPLAADAARIEPRVRPPGRCRRSSSRASLEAAQPAAEFTRHRRLHRRIKHGVDGDIAGDQSCSLLICSACSSTTATRSSAMA